MQGEFDKYVVALTEFDNNGEPVNPDRHDMNYTYTAGVLQTMWFTDYKSTWTKTFTYSGSDLIKSSRWIRS